MGYGFINFNKTVHILACMTTYNQKIVHYFLSWMSEDRVEGRIFAVELVYDFYFERREKSSCQ